MIANHVARATGDQVQRRLEALGVGMKMQDLPVELWHDSFRRYVLETPYRGGGPNLRLIRLDPRLPSLTVTAFIFNKFVHPAEHRYITVREAARLQGFPDDVAFAGGLGATQLQVGNAVPPPLAAAVLGAVVALLDGLAAHRPRYSAVSLFAGAGGFDIGARLTNRLDVLVSTDVWEDACRTLSSSVEPETRVVQADLTQVQSLRAFTGLARGELDLVFGGPPCQSFSQAGKQRAAGDDRGRLVFEHLRAIEELSPKCFVLENVSNIRGVAGGSLLRDLSAKARDLGYRVDHRVLNAVDYGVPQRRKRFFMIGVRDDLGAEPVWPEPTHGTGLAVVLGVGEAFTGLPTLGPVRQLLRTDAPEVLI